MVVVLTDGEENASQRYDIIAVRDLVRQKTEGNWEFIWLGFDEQSREFALGLGIPQENIELFEVTDEGIRDSVDKISDSVSLKNSPGAQPGGKMVSPLRGAPVKKHTPGRQRKKRQ